MRPDLHRSVGSRNVSGDSSGEGCERVIEGFVNRKYGVQFGVVKRMLDSLTRGYRLDIATSIFCCDVKPDENAESSAVDIVHSKGQSQF